MASDTVSAGREAKYCPMQPFYRRSDASDVSWDQYKEKYSPSECLRERCAWWVDYTKHSLRSEMCDGPDNPRKIVGCGMVVR